MAFGLANRTLRSGLLNGELLNFSKWKLLTGAALLAGVLLTGKWLLIQNEYKDVLSVESRLGETVYPYKRDSIDNAKLISEIKLLRKGEKFQKILNDLGLPNSINLTYKGYPVFPWATPAGFSLVYLLSQNRKHGSAMELNKRVIRLKFNSKKELNKVVIDTIDIREDIDSTQVFEDSLFFGRVKKPFLKKLPYIGSDSSGRLK
jgi:hypothetical protein